MHLDPCGHLFCRNCDQGYYGGKCFLCEGKIGRVY